MSFFQHIHEAITINKRRKKQYAYLSGGKTRFLSTWLITSERLTIPIARYYDWKAKPLNSEGIMVVKDDFVGMDIAPYDEDVKYKNSLSKALLNTCKIQLKETLESNPSRIKSIESLQEVSEKFTALYNVLMDLENENQVHLAMTKHVLESIIYISNNGVNYAKQSNNRSIPLTSSLLKLHKFALKNTLPMDVQANKFHQQNIGIIVNDMPEIPVH